MIPKNDLSESGDMCNTSSQSPRFPQRHGTSGLEIINTECLINDRTNITHQQYINHTILDKHYCTILSHLLLIIASPRSALTLSVYLSVSQSLFHASLTSSSNFQVSC